MDVPEYNLISLKYLIQYVGLSNWSLCDILWNSCDVEKSTDTKTSVDNHGEICCTGRSFFTNIQQKIFEIFPETLGT